MIRGLRQAAPGRKQHGRACPPEEDEHKAATLRMQGPGQGAANCPPQGRHMRQGRCRAAAAGRRCGPKGAGRRGRAAAGERRPKAAPAERRRARPCAAMAAKGQPPGAIRRGAAAGHLAAAEGGAAEAPLRQRRQPPQGARPRRAAAGPGPAPCGAAGDGPARRAGGNMRRRFARGGRGGAGIGRDGARAAPSCPPLAPAPPRAPHARKGRTARERRGEDGSPGSCVPAGAGLGRAYPWCSSGAKSPRSGTG